METFPTCYKCLTSLLSPHIACSGDGIHGQEGPEEALADAQATVSAAIVIRN